MRRLFIHRYGCGDAKLVGVAHNVTQGGCMKRIKGLMGLSLLMLSVPALANPQSCSSVRVEHDQGQRYLMTLRNDCNETVYVNYCYQSTTGHRQVNREKAEPGRAETDSFHAINGSIDYILGWSWNEVRGACG